MKHDVVKVFNKFAPSEVAALAAAGQRDIERAAREADARFEQRRAEARARFEQRR